MPSFEQSVPADLFLEHNGVRIYHTYKHNDVQSHISENFFVTNAYHGEDEAFDVRQLSTFPAEPVFPAKGSEHDTPENRQRWEQWRENIEEIQKMALRAAIDKGEIEADPDDEPDHASPDKPSIIIIVEGGIVQRIVSSTDLNVTLLDYDTFEGGDIEEDDTYEDKRYTFIGLEVPEDFATEETIIAAEWDQKIEDCLEEQREMNRVEFVLEEEGDPLQRDVEREVYARIDELLAQYNQNNPHPVFDLNEWRFDVKNEHTNSSYQDWLHGQLDMYAGDYQGYLHQYCPVGEPEPTFDEYLEGIHQDDQDAWLENLIAHKKAEMEADDEDEDEVDPEHRQANDPDEVFPKLMKGRQPTDQEIEEAHQKHVQNLVQDIKDFINRTGNPGHVPPLLKLADVTFNKPYDVGANILLTGLGSDPEKGIMLLSTHNNAPYRDELTATANAPMLEWIIQQLRQGHFKWGPQSAPSPESKL